MPYRIVCASAVLFAFSAASFAQITPVSGSRGISGSVRNGSQTLSSYSNSALFDVQTFNDLHSVGGGGGSGQMRIESNLTSSQWLIDGGSNADAMFASPGTVVTTDAFANLVFHVEAGTSLVVSYWSYGSYGNMNSRIRVQGAGLDIIATGGQNGQGGTRSVFVTEPSTVSLSAWGGGTSSSGYLPRYGYFEVTITATPVPAAGGAGLLALGVVFAARRNRR